MAKSKIIVLFCFLSIVAAGQAFAERTCTRETEHNPDGSISIHTECTASVVQTRPTFYVFRTWLQDLKDRLALSIQNMRDRMEVVFSSAADAKQKAADNQEKIERAAEDAKMKQQDQAIQAANLKARQDMQRQQQQDFLENLRSKTR